VYVDVVNETAALPRINILSTTSHAFICSCVVPGANGKLQTSASEPDVGNVPPRTFDTHRSVVPVLDRNVRRLCESPGRVYRAFVSPMTIMGIPADHLAMYADTWAKFIDLALISPASDPASVCKLYRSTHRPSEIRKRRNVNPLGVMQSPPLRLQSAHLTRSRSMYGKSDTVLRPDPIPAPPDVGVL